MPDVTWLAQVAPGGSDLERTFGLQRDAFNAVASVLDQLWELVDPVVLELARLRMATLHGNAFDLALRYEQARDAGLIEEKIGALSRFLVDESFSPKERACISYAEEFTIDSSSIAESVIADVLVHLDHAQLFALSQALSMFDAVQRACLTLDVRPASEQPSMIRTLRIPEPA